LRFREELRIFRKEYVTRIDDDSARYLFDKCKKQYSLHNVQLIFKGRITKSKAARGCTHLYNPSYGKFKIVIQLPHKPRLGLLIHEVAHAIELKSVFHNVVHIKLMRKISRFIVNHSEEWGYEEERIGK